MASIRKLILDAVVAALEAPAAGAALQPNELVVHRFRSLPVESADLPDLIVYPESESRKLESINWNTAELVLNVESRVKVESYEYADIKLDPLLVWCVRALKYEETLGGLAIQIVEGDLEWDLETPGDAFARAVQQFTVMYVSTETNPESQA